MKRLVLLSLLIFGSLCRADEHPNFIFFITDDVGCFDLGCYGNKAISTPNLDSLAENGLRFTNAYLTISSCSPSRCSIITSRYPHNTGAPELHTELPADQFRFPVALREAGYYTMLSGKNHMGDVSDAFETISKGKGFGKSEDWVDLLKKRPKDKPFFAWFASTDAHRPWDFDEVNKVYDPKDVWVPPFLYDGPETRQDLADYYHEVSRTDTNLGKLIGELKAQGIEKDTYIIYMADNGRPFPRSKTRMYNSGVQTPFLISRPGTIQPAVTDSLISSIDIAPTVLELAGLKPRETMQGVSFTAILNDPKATIRDVAFAEQNWHVYNAHQRMVRTGDFLYIKNAYPEVLPLSMESDPSYPAGAELWEKHDAGELNAAQSAMFQLPQPEEELYQVSDDPFQLTNLVGKAEYSDTLKQMRKLNQDWVEQTGDTIPTNPTPDRQTVDGVRVKNHKHLEFPGAAANATGITESGPIRLP